MNKASLIAGVATAVAAGAIAFSLAPSAPKAGIEIVRDATVQLNLFTADGALLGTCSGSLIDDPYKSDGDQTTILTAGHCATDDVSYATVNFGSVIGNVWVEGTSYGFTVANKSDESDVALYQAEIPTEVSSKLPEAVVYGGNVMFGDELTISGFPLGLPQDLVTGWASFIECMPEFANVMGITSCEWLRSSALISPGSSGSGVYKLTSDGYQLVGVVSGGYSGFGDLFTKFSYIVTVENLRSFLEGFAKRDIVA